MLYDDFLAACPDFNYGTTRHADAVGPMQARARLATPYVFDRDGVAMSCGVALSRPSSLIAALPYARLPAPATWLECANDDLRTVMAGLGSPNLAVPGAATRIERTGFLLREEWVAGNRDLVVEYIHRDRVIERALVLTDAAPVLGRFRFPAGEPTADALPPTVRPHVAGASGAIRRHLDLITRDPRQQSCSAALHAAFSAESHPDYISVRKGMARITGETATAAIEDAQAAEMERLFFLFTLPALILLNTRNAVRITDTPAPEKLNRARRSRGQPPMADHKTVTIHLEDTNRTNTHVGTGLRRAARATLVLGHFKVRRSGVFWWSPHTRSGRETPGARTFQVTR